jgi:WD40 repeat protein
MRAHAPSRDAAAHLWDLDTATVLAGPLPLRNYVNAVAFQPDGKAFAIGSADGQVRLWTLLASRNHRSFMFDGAVRRTAFSYDGRYIVVGRDKPIEIGSQSTLAFEDGRFGLFPNQTSMAEVSIVDLSTGNVREVFSEYKDLLGTALLALTSGPPGIGTLVATVHVGGSHSAPDSIHCVACSPSSPIAAATSRGGYALLVNMTTGHLICPPLPIGGTTDSKVFFSPDGHMLLTSCRDGPVHVWDAATGKPLFPALLSNGTANLALFSPDGGTIATAGKSGHIDLWDTMTGRLRKRCSDAGGEIRTFAFSHDGRTLLAGCDGYALRFDASTGTCLGPPLKTREDRVWGTEFGQDDRRFLTLSGDGFRKTGLMQIWDAQSERAIGPPMLDRLVLPAATFHPDGQLIATGDWEGKARLWDARSATPIGPALGEPGPVEAVAFSPDGHALAAGAHDGTLTLWPIPTAMRGTSEQIQVWLEWATGQELDESGVAHELGPHDRELRLESLRKLGEPPL